MRDNPPRFGHAILRSITEIYLVIAVTLLDLDQETVENNKKFVSRLQAQGEQMLLRRVISCNASVSRDLLASGLRLAEHRQLLAGTGQELALNRNGFAEEVVRALSAVSMNLSSPIAIAAFAIAAIMNPFQSVSILSSKLGLTLPCLRMNNFVLA